MEDAVQQIVAEISHAFAAERNAPFLSIVNSTMGFEPYEVAADFEDKRRWADLSSAWLDDSPSALAFLSDEAVCFFIPAFITADLQGSLVYVEPLFTLIHGFDNSSRDQQIRRGESETWTEYGKRRWARLTTSQALAIVHYLEWRIEKDGSYLASDALEALSTFWYDRASVNSKGN